MKEALWKRVWQKKLLGIGGYRSNPFSFSARRSNKPRFYLNLASGFFAFLVFSTILASLILAYYARDLPRPDRIVRKEGFATKIYDRNEKLIYDVYKKEKRTPVEIGKVPQYLKQATIAIEDKDFYKHKGFDIKGWLRIIYYAVRYHRLIGGSTLTQQLVKNVLLTNERTISRKIREFILALQIESRYSKDQILQMYLNESPYGGATAGVEEAAATYFGKSVSDLNLVESAILAGIPQNPPYYSPFGHEPKAYIDRAKQVLRRMREDDYITQEVEKESLALLPEIKFKKTAGTIKAPHFVMYVKKILIEKYGEKMVEEGGLRVITTLDLDFQDAAQATLAAEIAKVEKVHITNGAAIVMEPSTGEILAMIGSKRYDDPNYDGQVNVTTSLRQPGSAIKPITYLTALKKGYPLSTLLVDVKTGFPNGDKPDYEPENYNRKESGPVQLRYALGNSLNIPAVKLLAMVGLESMMKTAYEMGVTTLEPTAENLKKFGLSVTLGGGEVRLLELTAAYSAFANGGLKVEPTAILKITDSQGNLLSENDDRLKKPVISPEQAFLISHVLADNKARILTFGENNALVIPNREIAVKTGTTNDKKDNWTIGWTPQVMVGVWVGNNDNTAMKEVASGVSGASPIWRKIIMMALEDKPAIEFETPSGVLTADVDVVSGYRAHDGYPSRMEYFIKGTEPQGEDPAHLKMKVCKSSGKIATPVDIARGEYEEKEFFVFKEEDPMSGGNRNRWQEAIDRWVAAQSDSRYHPPTDYCETQNQIEVKVNEPSDRAQVSNRFPIKIEPISVNKIIKVQIHVNNQLVETIGSSPYERDLNLSDGTQTIKVRAEDDKGNSGEREIKIGVNVPWDYVVPTPTLSPVSVTPVITPT